MEIGYANEKLDYEKHLPTAGGNFRQMIVLVDCVDNHLARRELHRSLKELEPYDSHVKKDFAEHHFTSAAICRKLPAPSLLHPELLQNQENPLRRTGAFVATRQRISCPELVRLGEQSLNVNNRVAIAIGEMLTQFLLTNLLKRFANYFDLESGTSRSLYCTPENLEKALKEAADNPSKTRETKRLKSGK